MPSAECDDTVFNGFYNRQGFNVIAHFPELFSAGLEALFDTDADSFDLGSRLIAQTDKPFYGFAVCNEIIDYKFVF